MPKFSRTQVTRPPTGTLQSTSTRTLTHEKGAAWEQDAKTALFTLAATNMVSENTFYESGKVRDQRFVNLIHQVTAEDPSWVAAFVPFLREKMFMRSASVVMAAEYVADGGPGGRRVIDAACQRADEPAELLGYWVATYGKRIPKPVKRGLADACARLYTARNALRYDGQSRDWRMGDVIELTHARAKDAGQGRLYRWLLDRRHNRPDVGKLGYWSQVVAPGEQLSPEAYMERAAMDEIQAISERDFIAPVVAWDRLQRVPVEARRAMVERAAAGDSSMLAGLPSWEALAGWLQGPMDRAAWEAIIPSMGYMALLRNLRNFDQAGIGEEVAGKVIARLTDEEEVAKSRQFPYRFWSAWKEVPSERWSYALGKACDLACRNIPRLKGSTLVVVDVSGSMRAAVSNRSNVARWEVAAVFAGAMARACERVDLVCFGHANAKVPVDATASVMRYADAVRRVVESGQLGHATYGHTAIRDHYSGHNRVVLFTDDQMHDSLEPGDQNFWARGGGRQGADISHVPLLYTVDLGGYGRSSTEWGKGGRYGLGGFSDAGFAFMHMVENMQEGRWPWENI